MKSPELTIKEAENKITSKEKILAGLIDKREERLAFLEKAKGAKKEWRENVAEKKQLETAMAPYNKKIAKLESEITELKTKIREHKDNVPEQEVLEPTAGAEYVIETLDLENLIKKNDQVYQIANIEVKKIAAIPSRKRSPEQKQTKNRLEREMAALKERIEEMKALKSEIELSSQEIVDRKKKQNLLKWFVVNDFSAETKKFVELKSWEYDDGDFLNEQVPFGQFDPISDENNNLESVYINGIQIQLINRAQVTKGKLVEIADDKARFNVLGPDGKIIPGGANLTLSKADELAEAKSKERQKATVANFTSIPDTDAWNEGEIKKLTEAVNEKIRTFKKENGIALDPAIIPPVVQTVAPIVDDVLEGLLAELEQTEEELEIIQTEANPIQDALTRISNKIDELVATYKFKDSDLEDKPVVPPAPKAEIPKGEPLFDLREKKKNEPKKNDYEALEGDTKTDDDIDPTKKKADKKKDKAPEPKLENYKRFKSQFEQKYGPEISAIFIALEKTPEFNDTSLTEGKKMLIVSSAVSSILYRTEKITKGLAEQQSASSKNIFEKIKNKIKNTVNKSANEKMVMSALIQEKGPEADFLQKLVEHTRKVFDENNLDAVLSPEGDVLIDYAKTLEFGTNPQAIALNKAGNAFSNIPESWGVKGQATSQEYKRWTEAKEALDLAVQNMAPIYRARAEKELLTKADPDGLNADARGAFEAGSTKRLIEFISQFSKSPDDEAQELRQIATRTNMDRVKMALGKFFKSNLTLTRGAQFATGMGIRAAAGTALGGAIVAGSPIALAIASLSGATIGFAFRGGKIAKQKLLLEAENMRNATLYTTDPNGKKKFLKKESETSAIMAKIEHRTQRLSALAEELTNLSIVGASAIELANKKNQLETHLRYIETKIQKGEMNYGDTDGQYERKVGLMLAKQEADLAIIMATEFIKNGDDAWKGEYMGYSNTSTAFGKPIMKNTEGLTALDGKTVQGQTIKPDDVTRGYLYGKGTHDASDGRRQRLLSAIQTTNQKGSIRQEIKSARRSAEWIQRLKSARNGALMGALGAYAFNWFSHTSMGEAIRDTIKNVSHTPEGVDGDTVTIRHNPASHPDGTHPGVGKPELTQDDIQKSLSHVTIKKGEGIGSALLRFRHTDSFRLLEQNNPKLAGFFKGNIWEEAQKLHAFRPGNAGGDSLLVGEGSELGISPDGDIYLINTLKPGHPQLLGHINPQTGEFTDVPPNSEFHYRSPRHHSPSDNNQSHPARPHNTEGPDGTSHTNRPHNVEGPDAVEGDHANPPHNTEGPDEIPNANRPRNTEGGPDEIRNAERGQNGNEMPNGNRINRPHNVEGPDNEQNPGRPRNTEGPIERNNSVPRIKNTDNFSRDDWNRVHNISHRDLHDDLNQYFGKRNLWGEITNSGERSLPYQSLVNRDASSIMRHFKQHSGEFKPEVQKFLKHTQALAQAHPHISPSGKFGQYVENLYKADATEFVAKNPNIDPK